MVSGWSQRRQFVPTSDNATSVGCSSLKPLERCLAVIIVADDRLVNDKVPLGLLVESVVTGGR